MSERRRQHLANLALRSPNAGEREAARQQFLALDSPSVPQVPDLDVHQDARPTSNQALVHRLRVELVQSEMRESALRRDLDTARKNFDAIQKSLELAPKKVKKPGLRFTAFVVWAVLSAGVWGWGPLATFVSAWLVMMISAAWFEV